MADTARLALFPESASINEEGHLVIGGCDTVSLAEEYGTPLYIFDEQQLRNKCREFKNDFNAVYPGTTVLYASKAFLNTTLASLLKEEGMGMDVVSGGEISIALAAGFPLERAYFHGNNKSEDELKLALENGIGRVVVDNFYELSLLDTLAGAMNRTQKILLRLTPGIDPHTHKYISTGIVDSKFGFLMDSAEKAVTQAMAAPNLNLLGFHFHLGSLLLETEPWDEAIKLVMDFAARMKTAHGFILQEFNVGGGYAIQYTTNTPAPPARFYAEKIGEGIRAKCREHSMELPDLTIESGRAIVGRAGVALYRIGSSKDIPGIRRYVAVDGGMADNIRPALYEAEYEAVAANKANADSSEIVSIAGKYCESGDILIHDIALPPLESGDILAIADSGAYCLAMSSNYNASLRPAVVMVSEGAHRLIRRRETAEDLIRYDIKQG